MADLIGQSLGRYHILEQLGEGGMATVYKAYDTRLEREVAIKVIRTDLFGKAVIERILKRFEREAKSLAKLSHPNIVGVIDFGEYAEAPYLVLEYLPGGTLKERMMGKPMPWQDAVRLLIPIAIALDYAHEQKIIHRDVKPANILMTQKGLPMLSDFGIAKILELEDGQTLTGTGMGVGTPEYMSPEQGLGKEVDGRADIYSMGIIFYELVTGRKPYIADTPMAVVFKHISDPLPHPRQFMPDLPDAVEQVLLKALAKDPKDRYLDAGAFATAMENLLMGTGQKPVPTPSLIKSTVPNLETQDIYIQKETTSTQMMNLPVASQSKKTVRWPWVIGIGGVACLVFVAVLSIGGSFFARNLSSSNVTILPTATDSVVTTATDSVVTTEIPTLKTSGLLVKILSRGYILISTDPNYAPQSFLDTTAKRPADTKCPSDALTTTEMQGFDVDVAKAIGTALGVETCFATPGWDLLTAGNWANKWDMSVGSMTITTTRQAVLDFSVPYYYTPAVIAVAKDSSYDTLDSLAGQALCAGVSTTYESWLNNDMVALGLPESSVYSKVPSGVTVVPLDSDQECAQSIAAGRTDFVGYVTSGTVVDANLAAGLPVRKLEGVVYSEDLAAAFDKASTLSTTSLRAEVDKIFTAMHADGTLSALSIKWLDGQDLTQAPK